MLVFHKWLQAVYNVPPGLLTFLAIVNLSYASYALSLAWRKNRTLHAVVILVIGNCVWSIACLLFAYAYFAPAGFWMLLHLIGEAVYVGVLAHLELRWRNILGRPV